jgi:hypothetical protein
MLINNHKGQFCLIMAGEAIKIKSLILCLEDKQSIAYGVLIRWCVRRDLGNFQVKWLFN